MSLNVGRRKQGHRHEADASTDTYLLPRDIAPFYDSCMDTHEDLPADLIPTPKAARLVGCHICTIHRWVLRGKLRGWKRRVLDRGQTLVSRAELLDLAQPKRIEPPCLPIPLTPAEERRRRAKVDAYLDSKGL